MPASQQQQQQAVSASISAASPPSHVLVTGGNGFLALHVVKQLLESGRNVRATVRKIDRSAPKYAPLFALSDQFPGKLSLYEADLTSGPSAYDAALADGVVEGILHLASPVLFLGENAEELVVKPAINGTVSLLEAAAKHASVRRVVVTSSFVAVTDVGEHAGPDKVFTEDDWNTTSKLADGDALGAYQVSKTEAERAAWAFVEKRKPRFSLAVINPPYIFGDNINQADAASDLNLSSGVVLAYLSGQVGEKIPDGGLAVVDVKDAARAHILALDHPSASGRFIINGATLTYNDLAAILHDLYPTAKVPTQATNPDAKIYGISTQRASEVLGLKFRDVRETLKDQGDALIRMGLVQV